MALYTPVAARTPFTPLCALVRLVNKFGKNSGRTAQNAILADYVTL